MDVADKRRAGLAGLRFGGIAPLTLALCVLVLVMLVLSLATGPSDMGWRTALAALFRDSAGPETVVMREIRLPRAVLGALVGAALGARGEGLTRGWWFGPLWRRWGRG